MSSLESNLIINKNWHLSGESGEPDLSEYHMDKFNGFNKSGLKGDRQEGWYSGQGEKFLGSNTDDLNSGVVVHLGGDFRMAAAYLSNQGGAVQERLTNTEISNNSHQKFGDTAKDGVLYKNNYTYFLPQHIEWLTLDGTDLEKRIRIKKAIQKYGAVASAQNMRDNPLAIWQDGLEIHLNTRFEKLNHAISLIGWNDDVSYQGHKGAWLVKDSDHKNEETGKHIGKFYIMFDDLHVAKEKYMGGVVFRDVKYTKEKLNIYTHALHGWRYSTPANIEEVSSKFKIERSENLVALGIYTLGAKTSYKLRIKVNGTLQSEMNGVHEYPGFHRVEVAKLISVKKGDLVEIYQSNSDHRYAFDASFKMDILLNGKLPKWGEAVLVNSKAGADETSYRLIGESKFQDFKNFTETLSGKIEIKNAQENSTSNIVLNLYTQE
ncbi:hypothetical protein A9Q84_19215 [Halobacteriovorax marinus]|uniref:Peptidase C1A papain C-terminal domain-containing protein n=1 Tax=Halobacteriovorax marinus TaxID=97084 RepID=A0A1Y5F8V3_9BACT|nr:hypothetical protein A9Q84_19215 [Halobacteriovorax marinus]